MMMENLKGKTALVTGASSGIGADFARHLAAWGCNLILVARRESLLNALAAELINLHSVRVTVMTVDLTTPGSPADLYENIRHAGYRVDILVNNAGFGLNGEFTNIPWEREKNMLELDILVLTELTKLFLQDMVANRFGYIMMVSSLLAFLPTPTYATYVAAKAYVFSFSEALNFELRKHNVVCTALCPGFTETEFFHVANQKPNFFQRHLMMKSTDVALIGLRAMLKGGRSVVPGLLNKINSILFRVMPHSVAIKIAYLLMK
jgi:uncharacterized protein